MKKFETEVRLNWEMSLMDVTLIGVGAMIGAGIFVLTGIAAGVAGPGLILAFLLNGFVTLFNAMAYAELGSCFHDAGGGYLWVKEGLPRWNGFLAGWMSWFAHAVACSLYALEISVPKSGVRQLIPDKIVSELGRIRDRLNSQLKNVDGVLIEDKECILTIHYRNVDARWVPSILMMLKQEVRESITPLYLSFGKRVFEIRPKSNVHKGTAVLELLEEVKKDKFLPLYIGDDQTDEDAFRVLKRRGITIFVGLSGNSSTQYHVNDPFEAYQFLKMVKEEFRLL
jgi:hypothetical protein